MTQDLVAFSYLVVLMFGIMLGAVLLKLWQVFGQTVSLLITLLNRVTLDRANRKVNNAAHPKSEDR